MVKSFDKDTNFVSYAHEKGSSLYLLKDVKISINDYFKKEIQGRKDGQ